MIINQVHQILADYGCAVPASTLHREFRSEGGFKHIEIPQQIAELRKHYRVWYCRYRPGKGWRLGDKIN